MGIMDFLAGDGIRPPGPLESVTAAQGLGQSEIDAFKKSGLAGIRDVVFKQGNITTADVTKVTDAAKQRASSAFAVTSGILERAQRGGALDERQKASQAKRLNLRRALSQVDESNRSISGLRSNRDVVRSAAGGIRDVLFGQAAGAAAGAAEFEGQRESQFQEDQAAAAEARAAGIGQVAGIVSGGLPF